ncbi:MAG: GNAT family N-acetyltransferase [Kiloniellaceae bacterium]
MTVLKAGFAVREAGPLDVPVIAALHAECFADGLGGEVWSEAAIAAILAMPGAYGLLIAAMPAGAAAGFLLGRAAGGESEVLSLGVPKAWRRQGAGRALLRAALRRARADGTRRICLEAAEHNGAARGLYTAEGFSVVGRRPAYYRQGAGERAAALVFAREVG